MLATYTGEGEERARRKEGSRERERERSVTNMVSYMMIYMHRLHGG